MRVAITGATGLVGQAAVRRFAERGDEVVAIGREMGRLRRHFITLATDSGAEPGGVCCYESDYSQDSLEAAFAGAGAVIHLAARRIAPVAEGLTPFWEANVRTTENVVRAAGACGVARLCHASSISVYSLANRVPFIETEPPHPGSLYGISKLACEYLAALSARQVPMQVTALRIGRVLGHDLTGESYMLMTFVRLARERRRLCVWGQGVGARDTIYVRDVVGAIESALQPGAPGGVFNIGGGRAFSTREIAEMVNQVYGNPGNIEFDCTKPEDRSVSYMDCSRAESELGWRRQYTLRTALAEMRADDAREGLA